MHPNASIAYRPDVDGLRAVAVFAVLLFHAFPDAVPGGYIGVDVFFVISGYLITSIIAKSYANEGFSYVDFYLRRFRRIFPALVSVLLAALVAGWYIMLPIEYEQLAAHTLTGLGFVANIRLYLETGYFDTEAETKALLHLWSLGIEEQFYLLWPLILGLFIRLRLPVARFAALLLAVSLALSVWFSASHPEASFFLIHTRAWELLAGAWLAVSAWRTRAPLFRHAASGGLLLIVGAAFALEKNSIFPGWLATLPVAGAFLVIAQGEAAAGARPALARRFLAHPLTVYLGKISFPLYLWHWPLLTFLRLLDPDASAAARGIALLLAIGLSIATYHLIERWLRYGGRWRTLFLLVVSLLVALLAWNIQSRGGLDFRMRNINEKNISKDLRWGDARGKSDSCAAHFKEQFSGDCLIDDLDKEPDAIIIGDSHANHYYWGMAQALRAKAGLNLLQVASSGCIPLPEIVVNNRGKVYDHCPQAIDRALDYALGTPSVKTIILAGRWSAYISGHELREPGLVKDEKFIVAGKYDPDLTRHQLFQREMEKLLPRLIASGKNIVFVHDVHELPYKALHCLAWSPNKHIVRPPKRNCFQSLAAVEARDAEFRPTIAATLAKFPQLIVLDPRRHLCDASGCKGFANGDILYRDDDHLSYKGSLYVGDRLIDDLLAALRERARP